MDSGVAYVLATAEYLVRGGKPDSIMAKCPVCELPNVGPNHITPLGHRCQFGTCEPEPVPTEEEK